MFYDRRIPYYQGRLVVVVALVSGLGVAGQVWADAAPLGQVLAWGSGAALGVVALFALLSASQVLGDGTRVRVSTDALHVGYRRVPLEEIGAVTAVGPQQLAGAMLGWRIGDRRIGLTRKAISFGTTRAVAVRQRDGGSRPWWLLDVDDPDAFIAAIRAARAGADATTDPERDRG
jgi:hypothetical protein